MTRSSPARVIPLLRKALLGLTSASLLFTTTLTPVAAQGVPPGAMGAAAGATANAYSAEELEAILAPVALYPDKLLSTTLMAAVFPDQVAAAAGWARANRGLRGDALEASLRQVAWDPAVKSLVPFPQVLDMLAGHPDWMAQLAYAVTEQEAATFDAVQRLRRKAWLAGTLRSNSQQVVRMDGELIVIEPVAPTVVYVPVYNPTVVYGAWPYPAFPPYYFPPAYYVPADVLATGIYFGVGVLIVGSLWGWSYPRWHDRRFFVDRHRYEYFQHFHRPPPGDWGRWDRDHWRPPVRPGDGQVRPPPRFGDGHFRPPPGPGPGPGLGRDLGLGLGTGASGRHRPDPVRCTYLRDPAWHPVVRRAMARRGSEPRRDRAMGSSMHRRHPAAEASSARCRGLADLRVGRRQVAASSGPGLNGQAAGRRQAVASGTAAAGAMAAAKAAMTVPAVVGAGVSARPTT